MPLPKRLLITPGEPAGIGPDVTLALTQQAWASELMVVADPALLAARAKALNIQVTILEKELTEEPTPQKAGTLTVHPVSLSAPVVPGELNLKNAFYVENTLKIATSACLEKKAQGIITGPVNKEIMNAAGIPFSGHTEFFASLAGVNQTIMLFVVDQLKVALVTTHLPLAQVPAAITPERLTDVLMLLHHSLQTQFQLSQPKIGVCGLNPHAGEGGYLGREEIEIITPTLQALKTKGLLLSGPLPADTIFTPSQLKEYDVILAMYHDQALPVVKHIGFDRAVNVTLGLPFVRTSVDHGTALSIAGTGFAHPGSMLAAVTLAQQIIS